MFDKNKGVGQRLDKYITKRFPEYSRSMIQDVIKDGLVTVNGTIAKASYKLRSGDKIDIQLPKLILPKAEPVDIPLDIIYEDEHMLAINKSPDFVVHPSKGHWDDTLVNALLHHVGDLPETDDVYRPGIVHRIDKNTSGVILAAKTHKAHESLTNQFMARTVDKGYVALVERVPEFDEDWIDKDIARHRKYRERMAVVAPGTGKSSQSKYQVLERFQSHALVFVRPKTGRTHQIRVHMSAIRHPLVGDLIYGGKEFLTMQDLGADSEDVLIDRYALHAFTISIDHPATDERMTFTVPLYDDMAGAIHRLRELRPGSGVVDTHRDILEQVLPGR
jgi:23S rRNA pseudouridine1911/1915/1917 synthase